MKSSIITEESARTLIAFRKKGKTYSEMSHKTKISVQLIKMFFRESSRHTFDTIIERLKIDNPQQITSEAFVFYQKIWDQIRVKFKKARLLVPVVVYIFSKIKGINIDTKEFNKSIKVRFPHLNIK